MQSYFVLNHIVIFGARYFEISTLVHSYRGDILQANYIHWAKKKRRWSEGELAYVLGNTAEVVFNRNYCHFENDRSQGILFEKQNSIAAVLLDEEPLAVRDKVMWGHTKAGDPREVVYICPENKSSRVQTSAEILVEPESEDVRIVIECEYGFDIIVSEVKE